jgi:required for meiotic nuclear division protein 1
MQAQLLRPTTALSHQLLTGTSRRIGFDLYKPPPLRPLHASPIFQHPRRRDFFSSNAALQVQKSQAESDESRDSAQTQKRKTARPSAAKTSLRRVAVEAQRSQGGKLPKSTSQEDATPRLVTAYAVAETFDITHVVEILRSKGYEPDPLGTGLYPQVVHVQIPISSLYRSSNVSPLDLSPTDVGDVFIFPSGTLVTWALPAGFTSYFATRTLLPAAQNPHSEPIETEDLDYIEDATRETSSVRGDTIILGTKPHPSTDPDPQPSTTTIDTILTKIAFSSGFARSTKLAVLETNLSTYLTTTAKIPSLLSSGRRLPLAFSRSFILRKTGQLLQLRAQLNLYSELTDSLPDLFWDSRHELNLENYYDQVGRALDVGIRIKVLNEKMDYAGEIAQVLRERLSEKHGLFLEWTIIVLIAIEVGFEVLRLHREGFWEEVWEDRKRRGGGGGGREGKRVLDER